MLGWPRGPVVEAEAFSEDCTKLNSYSSALRDLVNLWRAVGGCWWRRGPDAPAREMVNQLPPPSLVGTCGWGGNGESLDVAPSSGIDHLLDSCTKNWEVLTYTTFGSGFWNPAELSVGPYCATCWLRVLRQPVYMLEPPFPCLWVDKTCLMGILSKLFD